MQGLQPTDYLPRRTFCEWLLRKCDGNPAFPPFILFIDGAGFSRHGIISFHNGRIWANENPH
jgi:hypothetical protein